MPIIFLSSGHPNRHAKDWTTSDKYFQVYTFSDNVMGLTVELSYTHSTESAFIDSIFNKIATSDSIGNVISQQVHSCLPIDTNGRLRFYRNIKLEDNLLNGIDKSFFVYCTKGVVQRTVKDVVFALDECRSNIVVFRFDKIDTRKYGQPMICSKTKLNMTFENFPEIDKEIQVAMLNEKFDYTDSMKTISFAHSDSLYFAYADDFNWNKEGDINNYYPGRAVYVKRNDKKLYRKWALSLDLFGIPCD